MVEHGKHIKRIIPQDNSSLSECTDIKLHNNESLLIIRTDSPLCDEVNKFLTELANRKDWRILERKQNNNETKSRL